MITITLEDRIFKSKVKYKILLIITNYLLIYKLYTK